ncbi:MAG: hypothetical protein JWM04_1716 [Verrucomicrobiales bacterium]|nr:hypothetical protein [Verrucomicrobiales bacterium]
MVGLAGAVVVLYCLFLVWKSLEANRAEYRKMVEESQRLKLVMQPYVDKADKIKTLMERYHLDPTRLSKTTAVAEASSAIQKAAMSSGIQFGPIRESPGRGSSKELASIKLEGMGPIPAVVAFFHRLDTIGYPLVIESVQLNPETSRPGSAKVSLTIILLDFEQWKKEEAPSV